MKPTIIVTGERENLPTEFNWICVPVLDFQALPVEATLVERLEKQPFEWIVFTSPRGVKFFTEVLLEHGAELPMQTQVACIGDKTAEAAALDGYNADFYPTEPGSEGFLSEFEALVANNLQKPTVLLIAAEEGRAAIAQRLEALSCPTTVMSVYRSVPKLSPQVELSSEQIAKANLLLFTSPLSTNAFLSLYSVSFAQPVAAMGHYTEEHLRTLGFKNVQILPSSDIERIGEIL